MSRLGLAARALRLTLSRTNADTTPDYDAASSSYDTYFSPVMGVHSLAALREVTVSPGDDVLELACGTGHLTEEIVRRLEGRGSVRAVDKSPGMLAVAKAKVLPEATRSPGLEVSLEVGDMEEFLRARPDDSADLVVIGWAICYSKPVRLLEQVKRVLRPGGRIVVIETRGDALKTLIEQLEKVFTADPSLLTGMIRVNLPKDAAAVARWFTKAGLTVDVQRDGQQVLPATTPDTALEWVQRSGAAAGFKDAVDQSREEHALELIRKGLADHVARHGALELRHTFVVVTGTNPGTTTGTGPGSRHREGVHSA
ncbi:MULTISPECIES: class I SAM-dependent methyltransferase [Kitasatospora]|uniref:Putative methyltransferase n=1 Tax=Kitasatospora setae (strain ATCC 33774 / DSM 43861 / JCM 3304 / KCC A-0304 / NBRC 14216 / KM-6054) TaxID=452652 RepID=E4NIQ5_KITSK|nr:MULTISPECIES: class I SAM-dependent methyltransferase [Kitasatospora]BAJ32853.1 putative methyltransferase [Kitasatospora setae KM-6054]